MWARPAVRFYGVHQCRHIFHGIIATFLFLAVSLKADSLQLAPLCLIQFNIRHDPKPDCIFKFVFIVGSVQIGDQPGQIAGFYHHLQRQIGNEELGLHPLILDLILVEKCRFVKHMLH